jgi:hypothetical protein
VAVYVYAHCTGLPHPTWSLLYLQYYHERNIRGGEKPFTSSLNICSEACFRRSRGGWTKYIYRLLPSPQPCDEILEKSMVARNRVGIGLSYRPARARICKCLRNIGIASKESIPKGLESIPGLLKRFTDSGSGDIGRQPDSLEWIPGLHKR